jgi:hypothetical protein
MKNRIETSLHVLFEKRIGPWAMDKDLFLQRVYQLYGIKFLSLLTLVWARTTNVKVRDAMKGYLMSKVTLDLPKLVRELVGLDNEVPPDPEFGYALGCVERLCELPEGIAVAAMLMEIQIRLAMVINANFESNRYGVLGPSGFGRDELLAAYAEGTPLSDDQVARALQACLPLVRHLLQLPQ